MQNETQNQNEQLRQIGQKIRDYQIKQGWSDAEMCKRFSGLGSTKTYKRILEGNLAELNVERQLHNYNGVWMLVEMQITNGVILEPIYELEHVTRTRLSVTECMQERGNDRFITIEGPTGSGKTESLNFIEERWPNVVIRVEANESWSVGNNPLRAMVVGLLQVADRSVDTPRNMVDCIAKLLGILNARKRILLIDEGHHIGAQGLNFLKTIINQTPTVIVLAAIPVLFSRLERKAYEECRQLTGNRLYERIRIPSPRASEIASFMAMRGVKFIDDKLAKQCAAKLAETAPLYANWKFVNRVTRKAKAMGDEPLTIDQFIEALNEVQRTR